MDLAEEFNYNYHSHQFDPGVLASYNNFIKYGWQKIDNNFIVIQQQKKKTIIVFNKDFNTNLLNSNHKTVIYKEELNNKENPKDFKIVEEIVYDLKKIFNAPHLDKNLRRGIKFDKRIEINETPTMDEKYFIFKQWEKIKLNDPKVYKIAFNQNRYLRTISLKSYGFNIIEFMISINKIPYAYLNYSRHLTNVYHLSFISDYMNDKLKLVNDMNECIFIHTLYRLFKQGIEKVNVGPTAGIKGLKIFKHKLPFEINKLYYKTLV